MSQKSNHPYSDPYFVILHGLDGSPAGHWQIWLAAELKGRGCKVLAPDLSHKSRPDLGEWLGELHHILKSAGRGAVVVAHSLGALSWLYYASKPEAVRVSRVLLVAPPGGCDIDQTGRVLGRTRLRFDRRRIHAAADQVLLVGSGNDPLCAESFITEYALPLALPFLKLSDEARHVNIESGYGPWPFALEWCLQTEENIRSQAGPALFCVAQLSVRNESRGSRLRIRPVSAPHQERHGDRRRRGVSGDQFHPPGHPDR